MLNTYLPVLKEFRDQGLHSINLDDPIKINENVYAASGLFFSLLPKDIPLPKIAPNDEGFLIVIWELDSETTFILIGEDRLYYAKDIYKTPKYKNDILFTKDIKSLPKEILEIIPKIN